MVALYQVHQHSCFLYILHVIFYVIDGAQNQNLKLQSKNHLIFHLPNIPHNLLQLQHQRCTEALQLHPHLPNQSTHPNQFKPNSNPQHLRLITSLYHPTTNESVQLDTTTDTNQLLEELGLEKRPSFSPVILKSIGRGADI